MPTYKLDPDWVYDYLEEQEQKLEKEVSPEQKEEIMGKIREMTLSILYKQAKRYLISF